MSRRARAALGGAAGLFCFLFAGLDLLLLGLVPLHSPIVTVLPVLGLAVGILWGWAAPLGVRSERAPVPGAAAMTSGRRRRPVRVVAMLGWLSLAGCDVVSGCNRTYESNLAGRELNFDTVIGGRVWHDLNGDGTRAADEPTLPGLTVSLSDGQVTATGADGRYAFIVKDPGTYQVDFDRPEGMRITAPDIGDDREDSDADA